MGLTGEETRNFARTLNEYKEAKRRILDKWASNCKVLLTLEALKDGWPDKLSAVLQPAFTFLQEHGLINFGVALQPLEPTVAAAPAEGADDTAVESAAGEGAVGAGPKQPGKADVVARLYSILRTADFAVMTEKKIRAQLEAELGCDMAPYKALVRKHVMYVVEHQDERETLEPLPLSDDEEGGEEGEPGPRARGAAAAKGGKGAGKTGTAAGKEAEAQPHVVVVGAGLAGLVAATVLQRNGCKVTVLEAQKQAGGRLAKLFQPPSAASAAAAAVTTAAAGSKEGEGAAPDAAFAALGLVSLRLPLPALASEGAEQAPDGDQPAGRSFERAEDERWPAGVAALRTLCTQLGIEPVPLEAAASTTAGGGGGVTGGDSRGGLVLHRPRLYGSGGGAELGAAAGVSLVAQDVHDEAEGLLAELLSSVRRRFDERAGRGKRQQPNGHVGALPARPPPGATSLAASLAAELEAELQQLLGSGSAAAAAAGGAGPSAAGGAKRPAEDGEDGADGDTPEAGADPAEGANRPAKRSRGDAAEGGASAEPGEAGAKPEAAEGKAAASAARAETRKEQAEARTDALGGEATPPPPPPGRKPRPEVVHVLRNHMLPLLELHLGGPLDRVSPGQLQLLPHPLQPLTPLPLRGGSSSSGNVVAAAAPTAARRLGLLPAGAARRVVVALSDGILDLRTGVVVTGVTVMAGGAVKVSTDTAGVIKAAAAVLAVPHAVLQSGAITLDPAAPPYRTAAASRVGGGAAVSLTLRLRASADLAALCGRAAAATGELRPFFVRCGVEPPPPPPPGDAKQQRGAGGEGLGFLFCSGERAEKGAVADAGEDAGKAGQEKELLVVAHVTAGPSAKSELSDEELGRHAVAALQTAAAAAVAAEGGERVASGESSSLRNQLEPLSCHVTRWGGPAPAAAAAGSGRAAAAAAAAARGGACAHLAARGDPQDMALLAGPLKGCVFFAGEHTAADQLPYGLLAALAGSGLREAARVLKALKSGGGSVAASAAGKPAASSVALEVGDEPPLQMLIAAAAAGAKAAAAAEAAAAKAAKADPKAGKRAGRGAENERAKARGRSTQVLVSDSEGSENEEEVAAAAKRRKKDGGDDQGSKAKGAGKAAKGGGKGRAEEDEEELEDTEGTAASSASEEEEEEAAGEKRGKTARKQQPKQKRKPKRGEEVEDDEDGQEEEEEEGGEGSDDDEDGQEEEEEAGGKKRRSTDKGKGKKKRRRGGGSDSDGGNEEEGVDGGGGKRSRGGGRRGEREKERKEDAVQLGLLDRQKRQQALAKLQAERRDVKGVYKAMMAAGNGNLAPLREQMASCAGLDAKLVMLQALGKSSPQVLQLLANDAAALSCLRDWLLELCDEASAEHLLLMELRLLERLPLSGEALVAAGAQEEEEGQEADGVAGCGGPHQQPVRALLAAVRERCAAHRSKDVKRAAALVAAAWERRAATFRGGAQGAGGSGGPTSADRAPSGGLPSATRPPLFNPKNLVALRKTPLPPPPGTAPAAAIRPPPGAAAPPRPPPAGANGGNEAASGHSGGSGGDAAAAAVTGPARLDPALEAKLLAARAAAEAARQEAALAAQRRAEVQQEAQAAGSARGTSIAIDTFEDYRRTEKTGAGAGGSGSGRPKDGGSGSGSGSGAAGGASGGKHKSSAGGGGSGGSCSGLQELKDAVVEHIRQLLKKHHKAGKISSSDFRLIQERASHKVFDTLTESSSSGGGHHGHGQPGPDGRRDLLGSKRREKIANLVEQYVKKAAGALAGSGGHMAPGVGGAGAGGSVPA